MKKFLLLCCAAAAFLSYAPAIAQESPSFATTENSKESDMFAGGWLITDDSKITADVKKVYEKATENRVGVNYEPIALLGTQLVAGTNYCLLCRMTIVVPDATPGYTLMYIYEDLDGNAEISGFQEITVGEMDKEER